jgi:hypothetical protein
MHLEQDETDSATITHWREKYNKTRNDKKFLKEEHEKLKK